MTDKILKVTVQLCFIAMIISLTSCATILGGKKNTIKVLAGAPVQAKVYLDGQYLGETPFTVRISKYKIQEGSIIEIKKVGFETYAYKVVRSPHILYVAADIITGAVPLIIDVANGNIYRPNTRRIEYNLIPLNADNMSPTANSFYQVD
jgi:hypothetical protein